MECINDTDKYCFSSIRSNYAEMCVSLGINLFGYNYNIWKDIDHQRADSNEDMFRGANVAYDMNVIVLIICVLFICRQFRGS